MVNRPTERGALDMAPTDSVNLTADAAFGLLANLYRRQILMTLLDHNPEDQTSISEDLTTNDTEHEAMRVQLNHVHLPKLEELGVIEWNRDAHVVTRGPTFEELRPLLELINQHRDELPDG